ncbi:hypothetical protein CHU98_g743 [Xylaria longipes]|nr:hypothetical protein CHU98_g743 [Xylaria longipes]
MDYINLQPQSYQYWSDEKSSGQYMVDVATEPRLAQIESPIPEYCPPQDWRFWGPTFRAYPYQSPYPEEPLVDPNPSPSAFGTGCDLANQRLPMTPQLPYQPPKHIEITKADACAMKTPAYYASAEKKYQIAQAPAPAPAPAPAIEAPSVEEGHIAKLPTRTIPRVAKSNSRRPKKADCLAASSKRRPQPYRRRRKTEPSCDDIDMPLHRSTMRHQRNEGSVSQPLDEFVLDRELSSVEEEEYQVNEIKNSIETKGHVKYLVKWEGFPCKMHWTWEPYDHFFTEGAKAAVLEFHQKTHGKPIDYRVL